MKDFVSLGSTPAGEECVQVGAENYYELSKEEAKKYITLLREKFGDETTKGCRLAAKSFPHDFGSYTEVVCHFDDNDEEAMKFAYNMENNLPEYWNE